MSEKNLMHRIMVALSDQGARIFRNHVGMAYQGTRVQHEMLQPGDVLLKNARPVTHGLGTGSSDLVGWTPVKITRAMVGQTVAVFTAIEVKADSDATEQQRNFIREVRRAGGVAGVARSVEQAVQTIEEWRHA